jgi:hypothetical protein
MTQYLVKHTDNFIFILIIKSVLSVFCVILVSNLNRFEVINI